MPKAKKVEDAALETAKSAQKKPAAKRSTRKSTKVELFIEYNGVQVSSDHIIENVKATYAANGGKSDAKSLKIYLKPEDNAAYYVVDEDTSEKMDVYFS